MVPALHPLQKPSFRTNSLPESMPRTKSPKCRMPSFCCADQQMTPQEPVRPRSPCSTSWPSSYTACKGLPVLNGMTHGFRLQGGCHGPTSRHSQCHLVPRLLPPPNKPTPCVSSSARSWWFTTKALPPILPLPSSNPFLPPTRVPTSNEWRRLRSPRTSLRISISGSVQP